MKFETLTSIAARLPRTNIDTDQIIPARFLKVTERAGVGAHLFADWRPELPQGAQIMIAGDNFGCGSSREHAVWALMDRGFRAVISTKFGDIFRQNALKNGLVPVVVDANVFAALLNTQPETLFTIDLRSQVLRAECLKPIAFEIDSFSRTCLLEDLDEIGYILAHEKQIASFEATH